MDHKLFIRLVKFISLFITAIGELDLAGQPLNTDRPIWSQRVNNSWQCGADYRLSVSCADNSTVIKIPRCYCMYYNKEADQTQLGYCLTTCFNVNRTLHIRLKRYSVADGNQFNLDMCSISAGSFVTNKVGRFCGNCKEGFGLDLNTNRLSKCIPCTNQNIAGNLLKHLAATLIPMGILFFILVTAKIPIISSKLNGVVFCMQVMLSSIILETTINTWFDTGAVTSKEIVGIKVFKLFMQLINLSFFQDFYPPNCLGPQFSVLHIVAIDYVVAVFPFFLIFMSYILIKMYDKNVTILVLAWKPVKYILDYLYSNDAPKSSLVEVFASYITLSSVKILTISLTLLSSIKVYNDQGQALNKRYLYIDASIEFCGPQHLPYAILAIAVALIFVVFPMLLQLLYPCRCFQKILNCLKWNSHVLRVFMDAFQGSYRIQPYDMRYFSAFYFFTRILLITLASHIHNYMEVIIYYIIALNLIALTVAAAQPYRISPHNYLEVVTILISTLPCLAITLMTIIVYFDHRIRGIVRMVNILAWSVTGVYWTSIFLWGLLGENVQVLFNKFMSKCGGRLNEAFCRIRGKKDKSVVEELDETRSLMRRL